MEQIWIGIAAQIPVVVLFAIFMLNWQKAQHAANERNHHIWQEWLNRMTSEDRDERAQWRDVLRARDAETIQALARLEKQMATLTNVILAWTATQGREMAAVVQILEELNQHKAHAPGADGDGRR
jgi:hypothetical protein